MEGLVEGLSLGEKLGSTEGLANGLLDGNFEGVEDGIAEGSFEGSGEGNADGLAVGLGEGNAVGVTLGVALGILVGHGVPPFPLPFPLEGGVPSTHVGGGTVGDGVGSTQFPHSQQVNGQVFFTSALSQYLLILSIFVASHPQPLTSFCPGLIIDSLLISNVPLVSWQSSSAVDVVTTPKNRRMTDDVFMMNSLLLKIL